LSGASREKGSTVDDTTAVDGSIDAVAASLIAGPPNDDEKEPRKLAQSDQDDAQDQPDAEDDGDAEDDTPDERDDDDSGEDEGEDEGEADDEADEPARQLFTVKVDGREQQVDLPELLRGYSGQSYIQQGMKQVAAAKSEVESVYSALQTERQQLAQFAQAAQQGQIPLRPPEMPDERLLQQDPIGYLEARVKYDKEVAVYQQAQSAMQELSARSAQAEERARAAHLADQHQQLTRLIPAFAKPETAAKMKQELLSVGRDEYGYTPDELQGITDARAIRVLHDAAQWRRVMAGKTANEKPVAPAAPRTPTIKPGAKPSAQQGNRAKTEKAKVQMKRTGSVDDVARFLLM
jgi:hypothetical protein